jgi:hypothetical protein
MKRTLQILIALAISSLFLVSPAAAASNQGLSWGVHLHDRLNYTLAINNATYHVSEAFYFNVTADPPTIPNSTTLLTQIPTVSLGAWWANGTMMPLAYAILFWIPTLLFGADLVVPIGNFTLLQQLVQTHIFWNSSTVFVSNSQSWGMKLVNAHPDETSTLEMSFLRSDGALATYSMIATNNTSHATLASLQVTRSGLPLDIIGLLQENILLVGIAAVIVIAGVVVCIRRK